MKEFYYLKKKAFINFFDYIKKSKHPERAKIYKLFYSSIKNNKIKIIKNIEQNNNDEEENASIDDSFL